MITQGKISKNKNRKSSHRKNALYIICKYIYIYAYIRLTYTYKIILHAPIPYINNVYQVIFLWNFCPSSMDSFLFQVPHAFWWEANICTCMSSCFLPVILFILNIIIILSIIIIICYYHDCYTIHIRLSTFKVESIQANHVFGGFFVQAHCMLVRMDCTEVAHG